MNLINYDTSTYEEFLDKTTNEALCMAMVKQEDPALYIVIHYLDIAECVVRDLDNTNVVRVLVRNRKTMIQCERSISKLQVKHYDPPEDMVRFNVRMLMQKAGVA